MPYEPPPGTQIIAHRGNSGPMPENTLVAIESAVDLGVDMVEIDVRLTKDGVAVLMHDDGVDITTSGTGCVRDLTWEELRTLDAGSWRGSEFAGESVRSLQEVLDMTVGRVPLNLDIKVPEAAEAAALAAAAADASGRVVISGCSESCLREVRSVANDISTLLNLDEFLAETRAVDAPAIALDSIVQAQELGVMAINIPHQLVDADLVDRAHDAAIGVWAYTVDDEARFRELVDFGVDSVTTNWPERMVPILRATLDRP